MNRLGATLDAVDRRIVALLRDDARRSTAGIARALNLSRTAVQARIARLERDRVILGYAARIAPGADARVAALVSIVIAVRPCAQVLDRLRDWPEVDRIYSVAGDRDAVLVVSVASPSALSAMADRIQAVDGVASVETTVILAEQPGGSVGV